jgi:hypothetical protein
MIDQLKKWKQVFVKDVTTKGNVWSCFYCICMHIEPAKIQCGMLATKETILSCIAFVLLMNIIEFEHYWHSSWSNPQGSTFVILLFENTFFNS